MAAVWPKALDPRTICLSVDVEWADSEVLADLVRLLDERGLKATFFCTHPDINVPGHERGLHPNFRRNGDTMKQLHEKVGTARAAEMDEREIYQHVITTTHAFAPEARGVRAHSLYYDSMLMPCYQEAGLQYDSSYQLPLTQDLHPMWKEYNILEMPIYFSDHFELKSKAAGFELSRLKLDQPGLKVINMHPNIVLTNASNNEEYLSTKAFYHDYERLIAARPARRGIRDLVLEMLDLIVSRSLPTATLGEVNEAWRTLKRW